MKYQSFLIKYGEIAVKGKNRYIFEDTLVRNISSALKCVDGRFRVYKSSGRIYVDADGEHDDREVVRALRKVFGIVGICPMVSFPDAGFSDMARKVIAYVDAAYPKKDFTFKVLARRARKDYPMQSMEIAAGLGDALLKAYPGLKVDVHSPQVYINVEVREDIKLYSHVIKAYGGMPTGTSAKAMLLLSGGIDSPVAGWMTAKRGAGIEAVYFHAPPYTSERAKRKVADLASVIAGYTGHVRLHIVNFTEIQMYIYETCPHDELTIIMRRYMMRIAEEIARQDGCIALVTGESIGQVASQTMEGLAVTNEVVSMPVFRPLIALDKQEIVDISEKIGTYDISIRPYEDCCTIFVARHPVTKPNAKAIRNSEQRLLQMDVMLKKAIESREIMEIRGFQPAE